MAWAKTGQQSTVRFPSAAQGWDLMGAPLALPADKEIKITEKVSTSVGPALLGISQHTSYHLGQLVTTRKALGKWSRDK